MKVAVASDHAGFPLKDRVLKQVRALGHEPIDLGTDSEVPVDYPDAARAVGQAIASGSTDRGVLLCGSGIGASVAANKMRGVRAAICHDTYSARQGVEHDDLNILTLGARVIGPELVPELVAAFLGATFSGEERHARRLRKIAQLEAEAAGDIPARTEETCPIPSSSCRNSASPPGMTTFAAICSRREAVTDDRGRRHHRPHVEPDDL